MNLEDLTDAGTDLLIEDIVRQAIKDYEYGLKYKNIVPKNVSQNQRKSKAASRLYDATLFFHSKYFRLMCDIDGDKLIMKIKEHFCLYTCSILSDDRAMKNGKRKKPLNINDL